MPTKGVEKMLATPRIVIEPCPGAPSSLKLTPGMYLSTPPSEVTPPAANACGSMTATDAGTSCTSWARREAVTMISSTSTWSAAMAADGPVRAISPHVAEATDRFSNERLERRMTVDLSPHRFSNAVGDEMDQSLPPIYKNSTDLWNPPAGQRRR